MENTDFVNKRKDGKVKYMSKLKEKVYDWKNRLRDRHMLSLVVSLIAIIVILGLYTYKKQRDYRQASESCKIINF